MSQEQNELQDSGAYEILKARLNKHGAVLRDKLKQLDSARKDIFGAIETTLLATERISTENNCTPWDMVSFGNQFLFGYNVQFGLKQEILVEDVLSFYKYEDRKFHQLDIEILKTDRFLDDFKNLYKYYKDTHFVKFAKLGVHLYMVFRIGKSESDIKVFKWLIKEGNLEYIDARSDHEFKYPAKYDFKWVKPRKEDYHDGAHPHVSIEDKVFVETVGGDLTIKVENNTEDGVGIYSEDVEFKEQNLHDADIQYTIVENVIILKILPYRENDWRYLVFNRKTQQVDRIDAIEESCILLPESQGVIFPKGFYLQSGEYKVFDHDCHDMTFEKKIVSPNGEDFLYIFYHKMSGLYLLLRYNTINRTVDTPITCNGLSLFGNGELCYFKADEEPKKHHTIQIWQTPFTSSDFEIPGDKDNTIYKIGNKEIVSAMSECNEVLHLIAREEAYAELYYDIKKKTGDVLDAYYWLDDKEVFTLNEALSEIQNSANSAIDEFEKVRQIRKNTKEQTELAFKNKDAFFVKIRTYAARDIDLFVKYIAELRTLRGEANALKDLRYADKERIDNLDAELVECYENLTQDCVDFLMRDDALKLYESKVEELKSSIDSLEKVVEADDTEEDIKNTSAELEMLIEVVSNLEIKDSTQTTRIIDNISTVFSTLNSVNAALKNKRTSLLGSESKAEFGAQMKLLDQGTVNFLDVADTPEKCEEYLTKLMVQLEELEGKFSEFNEYIERIQQKREEIYNAFDSKKVQLSEVKNKRITTLKQSADRIVNAVKNRLTRFKEQQEINSYYASDIMIQKARKIVEELIELNDTVAADDVESRLKTAREEANRQLKDKNDLFGEDGNTIKIGSQSFLVNTQKPGVTVISKNDKLYFHITGTDFFEEIENDELNQLLAYRDQTFPSESNAISRAEFLAYTLLNDDAVSLEDLHIKTEAELSTFVQQYMSGRFEEGYIKGVHDNDAAKILKELITIKLNAGLLAYAPETRVFAQVFWTEAIDEQVKTKLENRIIGAALLNQVFEGSSDFIQLIEDLEKQLETFASEQGLFEPSLSYQAANYLFEQISSGEDFIVDRNAADCATSFESYLKRNRKTSLFTKAKDALKDDVNNRFTQIKKWIEAFSSMIETPFNPKYISESAWLLCSSKPSKNIKVADSEGKIDKLISTHANIVEGEFELDYHAFITKLDYYSKVNIPEFKLYNELKKVLTHQFEKEIRLHEFKPRVMSSFVRNKLIDQVYFELLGKNLAKQMGAAGDQKRTDLMGMLLLISPPGYGKTTLMEYIANRLGLIFMKINGPAIGHEVTSVDPSQAPNASAKEELQKLNLSFEMGNNVMIYLDDIQHCNPEFLQKFISLCDAQRKIEGVYKGESKTYDFRGKKVSVVMAGNPYTESGDKFQIPDMLANRADIYNLGDIIGDSDDVFELSYVENSLTSNSYLQQVASKNVEDIYSLIDAIKSGSREGLELKGNYSSLEVNDILGVLEKMMVIRDIILKVNMAYIYSAGQEEQYRTEPPFKLQGSYRNMNKIVEKVVPMMNEDELRTLILAHYESESQTLTSGSEANLLKFKEMFEVATETELSRLADIRKTYVKNNKLNAGGDNPHMAALLDNMESISESLSNINTGIASLPAETEHKTVEVPGQIQAAVEPTPTPEKEDTSDWKFTKEDKLTLHKIEKYIAHLVRRGQ